MQGRDGTKARNYRSVARALADGDDLDVARAVAKKLAKTVDECESARDMKPLVSCLFETIDRVNALEAKDGAGCKVTPLKVVMEKARSA